MLKREKVALAITGVEFIGAFVAAKMFRKAVDKRVQEMYNCRDTKDYLDKVDKGIIRMDDSAKRVL